MRYILMVLILLLTGCSFAPVFEGDYRRNLGEIKREFKEVKQKVAENAGMVYTAITEDEKVAPVLAKKHAEDIAEWSKEDVELSEPNGGNMMMQILMGLLGLTGLGSSLGLVKKLRDARNLVASVAVMKPDQGIEEARKQGIKV